ncbi:16954_t:CDS:1, partial [Cetraspora pellucida]
GFLELSSYYCKFIKNFATIAKPLHCLLQKNTPYHWTIQQQLAFDTFKQHLISTPILHYSDFDRKFFLHTDTSEVGLNAILAQVRNDRKEYLVTYEVFLDLRKTILQLS